MPLLPAIVALALLPGAATHTCKSSDLRYPFQPGGPKTFGVFHLKATGTSCTTAHKVAKAWMKRFEADLKHGKVKLPKTVDGFTFTQLAAERRSDVQAKGRRNAATLRFSYVVPNG